MRCERVWRGVGVHALPVGEDLQADIVAGKRQGLPLFIQADVSVLIGHLYSNTRRTVGILDLGGGSTQITFLPKSKVRWLMRQTSLICKIIAHVAT